MDELSELLNQLESLLDLSPTPDETQNTDPDKPSSSDDRIYVGDPGVLDEDIHKPDEALIQLAQQALDQGLTDSDLNEFAKDQPYQPYPTPPQTAALLAATV